jgi:tRNA-specific 2-thiouridylase
MFYTLGQRQGLGIGGQSQAAESPWYVLRKDLIDNRLIVGQGHDHPALLRASLQAHEAHWVRGTPPERQFRCTARVRYRQQDQQASVCVLDDGTLHVDFDKPVRAATPGQSLVLYDRQECLGGAVISDLDGSSI